MIKGFKNSFDKDKLDYFKYNFDDLDIDSEDKNIPVDKKEN